MESNENHLVGSRDCFSLFNDVEVEKDHRVLLSFGESDKYLKLPKNWSFEKFKREVKSLFPQLSSSNFKLIDADFLELDEDGFTAVKNSFARETWLLVQKNETDEAAGSSSSSGSSQKVILDRPSYELLKYDVHPNALTQSGNYHFSSCYEAFCEFIDNSVQATNNNTDSRIIKLHVFEDWGIVCTFDNGVGMTSEGMKAFASYFWSQEDRGLEKGSSLTYGYLDGNISKFGVGATQAGFYLGNTIKVITKKKDSQSVTEITISKEKLHERAKKNLPVFQDYICTRRPGDKSTLDDAELCLRELVEREAESRQFTCVVISGMKLKHLAYIAQDDGKNLARDLAHVYHYYLHGIRGRLSQLKFCKMGDFKESEKLPIDLSVILHNKRGQDDEIAIKDVVDDLEDLYQKNAKSVFPFCMELNSNDQTKQQQIVQGCLLYFPNELGGETLPKSKGNKDEDRMFECFWQGRLAPQSYVNKLDFCSKPDNRKRKQRDVLPDICFQRVRGLLFFDRNTPVSNNKLKILLDTSRDLSDALSSASPAKRNLPKAFRDWLEECHRLHDLEFINPHPQEEQPNNGDLFCGGLKFKNSNGDIIYLRDDIVKIETRPVAYGKIMHFIQKGKTNKPGTVIYSKLPEEVYGDSTDEQPVMRIFGRPEPRELNKYLDAERVHLPKSIKIFEGGNRVSQVPDVLEFHAGKEMKTKTHFWVGIYNGERPAKNITDLHKKKLGVRLSITGRNPLINVSPVSRFYGFKPFYLDKVGKYIVTFAVVIGSQPCVVEKQIEIKIKSNVAETVNLLANSPDDVSLGESVISFTLSFLDNYKNPTTIFKEGKDHVELKCTAKHLQINGVEPKYKPDKDGILRVTGLSVVPKMGRQISLKRDYKFSVLAEKNIDAVMFTVKLLTGAPFEVKYTELETKEFENYDSFPEMDVKVLDKFNQPSLIPNNEQKLALICDAFTTPVLTSSVYQGKAKFPTTPIKVDNLKETMSQDVRISLIIPEVRKKRTFVKEVLKELSKFEIKILPSAPVRWSLFQPLVNTTIANGKKKDLADGIKITALDKHHNPTLLDGSIKPIITVEHADASSMVKYIGKLVFKKNAYHFTHESNVCGVAGQVMVSVRDQNNQLTKDTISIELKCGPPQQISVSCKSFEERPGNDSKNSFLRMYMRSAIPYPIVCNIQDAYGNPTETKTTLVIQWSDPSICENQKRMTKGNGEAIFPANSIRCNNKVEKASLTIRAPDLDVLKPYTIDVEMLQCNRVTKIAATVEDPDNLNACSNYPVIKITHETEDSVPAPNFISNVSLEFMKPSGACVPLPNVYPITEQVMQGNTGVLTPAPDHQLGESGKWVVSCKYTETRPFILQVSGNKVKISSYELDVKPGEVVKLCSSLPESTKLFGSSTANIHGRTLIPNTKAPAGRATNVFMNAVDEFGNNTQLNTQINVFVESVLGGRSTKDGAILPALESQCSSLTMKDGKIELPQIILKENVGNKIGDYYLVFSDNICKPCKIPFSFSTNEEIDKITKDLEPLHNEIDSLTTILRLEQKQLEGYRAKVGVTLQKLPKYFTTNKPDIQTIDIQIAKVRNEMYEFEQPAHHLRPVRKDCNYPPHNVRQYIKGLVCELAYISDENLCRILSWYAQGKMKNALCETKEQQRKVYDLGCPAYSENLFAKYQHPEYNHARGDLLPFDLPPLPPGFRSTIKFAVNLLQFSGENEHLRGSLFYSIFSKTIVLSDLEHAQLYREHLIRQNRRCPAILTINGDLIPSDGLMDPNRKCPKRLDQLSFTFGELPHTGKPEYQQLTADLRKLEELQKVTSDLNISEQKVQQCELDYNQRKEILQPRIADLESKLQSAHSKVEAVRNAGRARASVGSPPSKKKRR